MFAGGQHLLKSRLGDGGCVGALVFFDNLLITRTRLLLGRGRRLQLPFGLQGVALPIKRVTHFQERFGNPLWVAIDDGDPDKFLDGIVVVILRKMAFPDLELCACAVLIRLA